MKKAHDTWDRGRYLLHYSLVEWLDGLAACCMTLEHWNFLLGNRCTKVVEQWFLWVLALISFRLLRSRGDPLGKEQSIQR